MTVIYRHRNINYLSKFIGWCRLINVLQPNRYYDGSRAAVQIFQFNGISDI